MWPGHLPDPLQVRVRGEQSLALRPGQPSGAYCAAKSAEWSLTNALRAQLAEQGIRVAGVYAGDLRGRHQPTGAVRAAGGVAALYPELP